MTEPLVPLPVEQWARVKDEFKKDWPRGISGYTTLDTEEEILTKGVDYGFRAYCPYGDLTNGLVGINKKSKFYEVIIQCPKDDTSALINALKETKRIDWGQTIELPFAPKHVRDAVSTVFYEKNLEFGHITTTETFYLEVDAPYYDVTLPPDFTFKLLSPEHAKTVNDVWPHRYDSSLWYYEMLIKAQLGYGLFQNNELISWCFVKEMGALGHLYTPEEHRRKGYGELVLKLMSDMLRDKGKLVVAFCSVGNVSARKLYVKAGFSLTDAVDWCEIKPKTVNVT